MIIRTLIACGVCFNSAVAWWLYRARWPQGSTGPGE